MPVYPRLALYLKSQVQRFRELGFPVWMDDFGSGYSSFDVLQSIQFDLVKFDMSFMRKLDEGENGKIILTDLMRMATKLGLDTICEGVETEEQVRFLQEIGCAKLQGYYYSTPISLPCILQVVDEVSRTGMEDPEEEAYYEVIGRANLYDFSEISNKEDTTFQNVYSMIPMGIVEINKDSVHYIRSNQSYRALVKRFFNTDLSGSQTVVTVSSTEYNSFFSKMLRQCSETGKPLLVDEYLEDGTILQSFLRKMSVNPKTGTAAVAVAVLSVSDTDEGTTYSNIARALATDYYNIYDVNLETDRFIEYSRPSREEELALERHGDDFFHEVREAAMIRIYEEDWEDFLNGFVKENILSQIVQHGSYTTTYRLIDTGVPMYVTMRVTRMNPDNNHLIIGVRMMDSVRK